MKNQKLEKLASERSIPCVTISMNTHRTHPDNAQDVIGLKNLLKEAEERIVAEYGKREVSDLLDKINAVEDEIDVNYNLDSLHIFLSNTTMEIVKSPLPTTDNAVHIGESFATKPLLKALNKTEEYYILLMSQSGVKLLHTINDTIADEIRNEEFPFTQNLHYLTHHDKLSDGKQVDNMVREFLNKVDKAFVKVYNETNLNCVVVCTEDNYSRLVQVMDQPSAYLGFVNINYNDLSNKTLAADAWEVVSALQKERRGNDIQEMQEAVGQGKVITDLAEIFRAAKEGRGDLLITRTDYQQAVKMTGEYSFDLVSDVTQPDVIDDLTSDIAWEVISKKGRAVFTNQEEFETLGDIALKVRY